jgi:hypothetical protein
MIEIFGVSCSYKKYSLCVVFLLYLYLLVSFLLIGLGGLMHEESRFNSSLVFLS